MCTLYSMRTLSTIYIHCMHYVHCKHCVIHKTTPELSSRPEICTGRFRIALRVFCVFPPVTKPTNNTFRGPRTVPGHTRHAIWSTMLLRIYSSEPFWSPLCYDARLRASVCSSVKCMCLMPWTWNPDNIYIYIYIKKIDTW